MRAVWLLLMIVAWSTTLFLCGHAAGFFLKGWPCLCVKLGVFALTVYSLTREINDARQVSPADAA
jgi:hypothetical protein